MSEQENSDQTTPQLVSGPHGLELVSGELRLRGDFSALMHRCTQRALSQEPLVKAVRIKGTDDISVVDATAGLGEDSFIIAASGAHVVMFERDDKIAALVADALKRAQSTSETASIAARLSLICADSITGLGNLEYSPDVVYLDPMFPAKKKSALTNKKLQLIRMLEKPCTDAEALLDTALNTAKRKVVVKRPQKGAALTDKKPSYSLEGKTIRFDVYAL